MKWKIRVLSATAALVVVIGPTVAPAQQSVPPVVVGGQVPAPPRSTAALVQDTAPPVVVVGQVAAAPALKAYRIAPGDEIEVYVWGEERLQRVVKVLPDGTFAFPLVGQLNALNKLPTDLEKVIAEGLKSQYRDRVPQVTVSVKSSTGLTFSMAGKVHSPGNFNPGRYINILEAIAMAGGPADFADLNNVSIIRHKGNGLTVIKVRLSDVMKGNLSSRDVNGLPVLEGGDSVIVP